MTHSRYFMLLILYLAGISAPINQFKVPPMMEQLMEAHNISFVASGWLMAVFALVGVLFALPSGFVLRRIGLKTSGIIALSAMLAGSLMGTVSGSAPLMLFSRTIEGIGLCLISITAPAAISVWFPPGRRGAAMGVWATWVPVGTIVMFTCAPFFGEWRMVWGVSTVYTALMLFLFCKFFKMPQGREDHGLSQPAAIKSHSFGNKTIWQLALVFMIFNITTISLKTYAPVFLMEEHSFTELKASAMTSIIMVFSIIMGPVAGLLSDIIKSRKAFLITGLVFAVFVMSALFTADVLWLPVLFVLVGMAGGIIPFAVFSLTPEIMIAPQLAGTGMSIVALGQNLGMFAGPVLFSTLAGLYNWQVAGVCIAVLLTGACVMSAMLKVR